jgi:Carboxypeptidase regulatory-like domain
MRDRRQFSRVLVYFLAALSLLWGAGRIFGQSATSGAVVGSVKDPTGAVVNGADVTLIETATNQKQTAITDSAGRFFFPSVPPGEYTLTISAKGFRKTTIYKLVVVVDKSAVVDQSLEVGATSEVVEVSASTMNELQTEDSSVGEVLSGTELNRLPVAGRSAAQLVFYQPAVTPDVGGGDIMGGQIAGSRSDQVTFTVDGGDATSDLEGSNSYAGPSREPTAISPVVPIPQDSVDEFRVATNNQNSSFGNSSGGQVAVVTKSGTNAIHGSLYEYHEDDGIDANGWTNDHYGITKPPFVDNRFGVGVGGPIIKDKLFYYGFYEGRRFHDQTLIDRIVPTASLRSGIIKWSDASGAIHSENFNPANGPLASDCGPAGANACDPRGLGASPAVLAQLALLPTGNNPNEGDGINTIGYDEPAATPISTNVFKLKLNYTINSKWSSFVSYQYAGTQRTGSEQINIEGPLPKAVSGDPYYSGFVTFQLQGQLTPKLLSVTHGSFLRNFWGWTRVAPAPFVTGANGTVQAMQIAGEDQGEEGDFGGTGKLFADPININTQQARPRVWNGHDWFIGQDFTKIQGAHQIQFGGSGRVWHDYHLRTDQVLGGLTTGPIMYVGSSNLSQDSFAGVSAAYQPNGTLFPGSDADFWNGYYASILGIVDHTAQVETRNGSFIANPLGTPTAAHVTMPFFDSYVQDVWKARKNLTVTAGLNWGVVLAPSEAQGLEATVVYADSNTPVNIRQFLLARGAALEAGNNYNPELGVAPVNSLVAPWNGKMRQSFWKNVGPRFAVAWEPTHNMVVRGGYSLIFDRTSAVTSVLSGLLAGGLADVDTCGGPTFNGTGTAVCSGTLTDPTTAFRVGPTSAGFDGLSVPVAAPVNNPIPLIPQGSSLSRSFGADAFFTPGYAHAIDFSVQRVLPHNLFVEVGYIGRFSRNLTNDEQINAPDLKQKDPVSGQLYAQAFDAISNAFLAGNTAAVQPFFEHMMATTGPNAVCTVGSCTALAQALMPSVGPGDFGFFDYLMNLPGVFGPGPAFTVPTSNNQIFEDAQVTHGGFDDYNAGFVSVRKPMSHGLQFQANYTWAHAIGNQGTNQQYIYSSQDPYNYGLDRSTEGYDHRNVVNGTWYYELPFGKGKAFATDNRVLDRIIGGWTTGGIFTFYTGQPACAVNDASNYGSFFEEGCALTTSPLPSWGKHYNVTGANGIATNGNINVFANPVAVYDSLLYPQISAAAAPGYHISYDQMHGFSYWNFDLSLNKKFAITERVGVNIGADAFNILNHVTFLGPDLDLLNPAAFGVITTQFAPSISPTGARTMQLGARIEF